MYYNNGSKFSYFEDISNSELFANREDMATNKNLNIGPFLGDQYQKDL